MRSNTETLAKHVDETLQSLKATPAELSKMTLDNMANRQTELQDAADAAAHTLKRRLAQSLDDANDTSKRLIGKGKKAALRAGYQTSKELKRYAKDSSRYISDHPRQSLLVVTALGLVASALTLWMLGTMRRDRD